MKIKLNMVSLKSIINNSTTTAATNNNNNNNNNNNVYSYSKHTNKYYRVMTYCFTLE